MGDDYELCTTISYESNVCNGRSYNDYIVGKVNHILRNKFYDNGYRFHKLFN